jgi:magnesium transporter
MFRRIKKRSKKVGLPPGTLVHIGEKKTDKAKITVIDYDETSFQEREVTSVEECLPFKEKPAITWMNIDGVHDVEIIEKIGKCFELHPLVLEDIVNTEQRPKMEDYEGYLFVVLKMIYYDKDEQKITVEQVSLILGPNYVISFQERRGDVFNILRGRIKAGKGRIRKGGAGYLAYALMDAVVDHYFVILEKIGEEIENIEEELLRNPKPETLQSLHNFKREMIYLRKSVWPLRELVSGLERLESPLLKKANKAFFRDVYDHTIQVIDTVETFRDMISGMFDLYLSSISNKMNEVMKVLTIIATIFIPLTFLAGIYGMNFEYMPELKWHWFYPRVFWLVMLAIAGMMLFYFRRKKWL